MWWKAAPLGKLRPTHLALRSLGLTRCSAPSGPALGLVAAVRDSHLQPDHGWSCAQSTTDRYNKCVKLARAWLRTRSGRQPKVRIRQQRLAARITALCDIRHCNPTQSVYAVNVSLQPSKIKHG